MTSAIDTVASGSAVHNTPQMSPGCRWWRVDIHAHSPASRDYGGGEGQDNDAEKPSFREWIQAYIDAGIDGVVITDHNTHEGIEQARMALDELRQQNHALPELVLFPGVELTVSGGVHVLGIFDPTSPAETINKVITRCDYDGTRGGSTQTANATVVDAAQEIEKEGGICVPAHADKNAGIFTRSQLDLPTIKQTNIVAVEITDDAEVGTAERHGWVAVLGSDAHFLDTDGCPADEEAKAPGTHFTWIKAENLNLDGLKLALTDSKESVRRGRISDTDPNEIFHGHIDQITVTHRGSTETFRFNPWDCPEFAWHLTCGDFLAESDATYAQALSRDNHLQGRRDSRAGRSHRRHHRLARRREPVVLAGFGTFETRERTGRNPQTGESIDIAASTPAAFRPAAALKRAVAGN